MPYSYFYPLSLFRIWHDCSTVTDTIVQKSLAQLFNSGWHNCSAVTGMIVQQSLGWLFNSYWHDSSTSNGQKHFLLWYSLLTNLAMYEEYATWSIISVWYLMAVSYFLLGVWSCFDSLHIYKNPVNKLGDNFDADADSGKVGLHTYRYGSCTGNFCGPNYCCCFYNRLKK